MRVCVITEIISHYRLPVFNAISKQDVDLQVFYLRENVAERQWQVYKEDISHRYMVLPGFHFSPSPSRNFYFNPTIGRALSAFDPDIIICGGYNHSAALHALVWARLRKRIFILWSESTLRDDRARRRVYEIYKRWVVRSCQRFVVPGTAAKAYMEYLGADPSRIWVAPDAVENAWFEPPAQRETGTNGKKIRLLYVGRFVPSKCLPLLLEAARELVNRFSFELCLVGDGEERSRLESFCEQHSLHQVKLAAFVQPKELPAFYWAADGFVFPTMTDVWGLVLNEAMVAGLPIISSSAAGAVDDLVIEGYNGLIFKPNDVGSLVAALERFLTFPARTRQEMGENSRRIIQYFTPERCARGFLEAARGDPNQVREEYEHFRKTAAPVGAR